MSTPARPMSPFRRAFREIQLGLCFGFAAFVIGVPLIARLKLALWSPLESWGAGPLLELLVESLVSQLPVLVAAPGIAYLAGLLIEGSRWRLAIAMAIGTQLFPIGIAFTTGGLDALITPAFLGVVVLGSVGGAILCALAYARAQARARAREARPEQAAVPAATLANIDFTAVAKSEGAAPAEAPAPVAEPAAQTEAPASAASEQPPARNAAQG